MELARSGRRGSAEFRSLHEQAIRERAASSARYLANTLKSLEEINKHAAEAGLLLGVENRFYYREIPSFEEIGIILNRFKGSNIFYWHDTGHAAVMEFLGLGRQVDFLNCYGAGVIGMHLHDVLNGQDHLVPSRGELDFSQFKPYLKQNTLKVMEAHQPSAAEELAKGREFLERIFRGYA
jgi:sugar phosphate isomerase/epimerase